MSPDLL